LIVYFGLFFSYPGFAGEVEAGELAVQDLGIFVVGFGDGDLVGEVSEVVSFIVGLNYSDPFFAALVPADTLVP